MRRVPCVDKLHAITGFRPQTSLAEIIDRVASYLRSNRVESNHRAATSSVA
jgi:nucleoside-diphosphate-sugar epimerase